MIRAIFAIDKGYAMANKGDLPWPHCSRDLKYFKKKTTNNIVIMGRNTWESEITPKPFLQRHNIVITNRPLDKEYLNTETISSAVLPLDIQIKGIQELHPEKDVYIIGGPNLLMQCKEIVDTIYVSLFDGRWQADTFLDKSFFDGYKLVTCKPLDDTYYKMIYHKQ